MEYSVVLTWAGQVVDYSPHLEGMGAARKEAASYIKAHRALGGSAYINEPGTCWELLPSLDGKGSKRTGYLRLMGIAHPYEERQEED